MTSGHSDSSLASVFPPEEWGQGRTVAEAPGRFFSSLSSPCSASQLPKLLEGEEERLRYGDRRGQFVNSVITLGVQTELNKCRRAHKAAGSGQVGSLRWGFPKLPKPDSLRDSRIVPHSWSVPSVPFRPCSQPFGTPAQLPGQPTPAQGIIITYAWDCALPLLTHPPWLPIILPQDFSLVVEACVILPYSPHYHYPLLFFWSRPPHHPAHLTPEISICPCHSFCPECHLLPFFSHS